MSCAKGLALAVLGRSASDFTSLWTVKCRLPLDAIARDARMGVQARRIDSTFCALQRKDQHRGVQKLYAL